MVAACVAMNTEFGNVGMPPTIEHLGLDGKMGSCESVWCWVAVA